MTTGPKKQPKVVAMQKGTFRQSRYQTDSEPLIFPSLTEVPKPPDSLGEVGKKVWNEMLTEMIKVPGYVSLVDLPLFEQLCYCSQEIVSIKEILAVEGTLIKNSRGVRQINPAYKMLIQIEKLCFQIGASFGLNPVDRAKIKVQVTKEKVDPLDKFR